MTALSRMSSLPRYLNPKLMPMARRVAPLAVLHHRGRSSGRAYDTPVQAYRSGNGFLVGLAYDSNAQWALNILAAETAELTRAGRRYTITHPRRRGPEARRDLPAPVALAMRALGVEEFLEFDATPHVEPALVQETSVPPGGRKRRPRPAHRQGPGRRRR